MKYLKIGRRNSAYERTLIMNKNLVITIYKLSTIIDGFKYSYIGATKNMYKRLACHKSNMKPGNNNLTTIQWSSFCKQNRLTWDDINVEVLFECYLDEAIEIELQAIENALGSKKEISLNGKRLIPYCPTRIRNIVNKM